MDQIFCLVLGTKWFKRAIFVLVVLLACFSAAERWDPPVSRAVPKLSAFEERRLSARTERLAAAIRRLAPSGNFVVVDTARNRLYLKNGEKTLLDAVCSTGNGKVLFDPDKNRSWQFDTPRGSFRIFRKVHEPKWIKPDWAFLEEGEEIPHSVSERVEEEMLGNYALHIGDGYLIHGTLYSRLLGRSVTHGCVRLGDADLEKVYRASPIGTTVLIY
ncbi:L,D-transpeptidase [bacterium]|nr:L,D-transpeptidase [bacterium]